MHMTETETKLNEAVNQIARAQVELGDRLEVMVKNAVKETVNGKLDPNSPTFALKPMYDNLDAINAHMAETKQLMEAFKGVRALGEGIKWVSGVALAFAGVWALLVGKIKL